MIDNEVINTLLNGDIITGTYADIYLDNELCIGDDYENYKNIQKSYTSEASYSSTWVSPSDKLIGIVELEPPFTSKITRGETHEGILSLGNIILENERKRFKKKLAKILDDDDAAWNYILENEMQAVVSELNKIFKKKLKVKSCTMMNEIFSFYQKTLIDLEKHIKTEVKKILVSSHASVISELDALIQKKLKKEKTILSELLNKQYAQEVNKINEYYKLLLDNELSKHKKMKNNAIHEKNMALKAFYKQIEAERLTSTMYVMCLERKKCKIKNILLENYQNIEIIEHLQKLIKMDVVLDDLSKKDVPVSILNRQWEERVVKILQLFLKFMSFSFKLLPEQTSFLLDFEKMVILQLNEIQKQPDFISSILINEDEQENVFHFNPPSVDTSVCDEKPFVMLGDLSESESKRYGSRESLNSDVDLPYFRLQRQYVYAKCHGFEDIKKMLDSKICKCRKEPSQTISLKSVETTEQLSEAASSENLSLYERLFITDINRLRECPTKICKKPIKITDFPHLANYLDFSEENYLKIKTIIGTNLEEILSVAETNIKDIAYSELPFSATNEKTKNIGTQCSSKEDINSAKKNNEFTCECTDDIKNICTCNIHVPISHKNNNIEDIFMRRERSLNQFLHDNPNLFYIFSEESYDYKL